jgi:hypothetical protein
VRRRLATTTVCVVGERTADALDHLDPAANVRVHRAEADDLLDGAVDAARAASGTQLPFFAFDADPLGLVATAWARRFDVDSPAPPGELEVAVAETLARWRAGSLDLPDFYLLTEAESLPRLHRDWYLGVLGAAAPQRMVLAGGSLSSTLRRLPAGPWWPELDRLLDGVDRLEHAAAVVGDRLVAQTAHGSGERFGRERGVTSEA